MKTRLFPTVAAVLTTITLGLGIPVQGAVLPPTLPGNSGSSGSSSSTTGTNNSAGTAATNTLPSIPSVSPGTNSASQTAPSANPGNSASARARSINLPANANTNAFARITNRVDLRSLPDPLKARLRELAQRPHTFVPQRTFPAGTGVVSQLTGYALLNDSGIVSSNLFATSLNSVAPSTNAGLRANTNLGPIGAVRILQITSTNTTNVASNSNDPGCFDFFTDVAGIGPIQNESGWYEGWLIHDLVVPAVAAANTNGSATAGSITADDATALTSLGTGNNVPGAVFTLDGNVPTAATNTGQGGISTTNAASTNMTASPVPSFNTIAVYVSAGTFNALQRNDAHAYKQINRYTDWAFPVYEFPFTGGLEGAFEMGLIGARSSIVPGSGPAGITNSPVLYGDNPNNPRDPDRTPFTLRTNNSSGLINTNLANPEFRLRMIPSGIAREILLDVLMRRASFEPTVTDFNQRLFDAYAAEVAKVDTNRDGVVSFEEADAAANAGVPMFIPVSEFNRFAVTREINDGLLAPRFAPSQRAWVLQGTLQSVQTPPVTSTTLTEEEE
ncbi:MAG: hypothetical protein JWM16_4074 [Verrucomicrobiales bacterium]|nr:hypothetical protein [Verrucomicrobiales bacterium]